MTAEKESPVIRLIAKYYEFKDAHTKTTAVNRKTYLWLCLLGFAGIHHFYAHHYVKGLVSLALSWTGIPAGLAMIDWMAAVPKKADEKGNILV